jgi:putative ABC transport system permease protein
VWRTIVGVSPLIKHGSPEDGYENAVAYIPYRQETPATASLLVRTALPPGSVADAVRREVQAIDQDQPIFSIQTLREVSAQDRWWWRVWGGMFGIFAIIALVLSSVGLYAVMAYSVTQRTQEIGVRMAVGAQRWQVSWMILKLGLAQLAVGVPLGLGGAWMLSRVLRRAVIEVDSSSHPATFVGIVSLLTIVSITACLLPARRATRVDPVVALRAD